MYFRILGPFEVLSDQGEPVPVPGRRERALVSVLLVFAGRACSRDLVARAVWAEAQPADPAAALRVCMTRARRALGRTGCLTTLDGAYRADPAPGELDLARFRRFRDAGTRLTSEGDLRAAAGALEAALDCWRGRPLADVRPVPVMAAEAVRLVEERRLADLALADVRLDLGEHYQIVADLHARAVADPLCERRWAQLVLALYRCGRRSEALAAYSRARAELIGEYGTGPGPELAGLLASILRDNPAHAPGPGSRAALAARLG